MGLGIHLIAPLPLHGSRPVKWAEFQKLVAATLEGEFTELHENDDGFELDLHIGTEFLRFAPEGNDRFAVETKTSTLGPGFHAHVVDLIDRIAAAGSIKLDWSEADETDYAMSRDFDALQQQMADMFFAIINAMTKTKRDSGACINWSMDLPIPRGNAGGLFTPSGPLTAHTCREIVDRKDFNKHCREYFVWWNQDRDADYWRKLANLILWSEVKWRPPASDWEASTWAIALKAEAELERLGTEHQLPAPEMSELKELMEWDDDEPCREPSPKGIGYFRHNVQMPLPGNWGFTIGGYFFDDIEESDEGDTLLWFFNDRNVRFSSAAISGEATGPAPAAELLEHATDGAPPNAEIIDLKLGQALARGYIGADTDEESGETYSVLSATIAIGGHVAWFTACFIDPDDREWAMDVLRSVTPPTAASDADFVAD